MAQEPDEPRETLQEVLSDPRFSPREYSTSWWEMMKLRAGEWIGRELDRFRSMMRDWTKDIGENATVPPFFERLAYFLLRVVEFLLDWSGFLIWGAILLAVAWFVYRYRDELVVLASRLSTRSVEHQVAGRYDSPTDFAALLSAGNYRALLEAIRKSLRQDAEKLLKKGPALTDRELVVHVPPGFPGNEALGRTVGAFERTAFAGESFERKDAEILLTELERYRGGRGA